MDNVLDLPLNKPIKVKIFFSVNIKQIHLRLFQVLPVGMVIVRTIFFFFSISASDCEDSIECVCCDLIFKTLDYKIKILIYHEILLFDLKNNKKSQIVLF
jgi:hypothetical protein